MNDVLKSIINEDSLEEILNPQLIFEPAESTTQSNQLEILAESTTEDVYSNSNIVFGTATDDSWIVGSDKKDAIFGGAGQDVAFGGAGNDSLFGEQGNDTLLGGIGKTGCTAAKTMTFLMVEKGKINSTVALATIR